MKKTIFIALIFLFLLSCQKQQKAKYVFLFIGDGMGAVHAQIADIYAKEVLNQHGIIFLNFPYSALTKTNCADKDKITDSGAGGTAIATGHKTQFHTIGKNKNTGQIFKTIAELAKENGWKIGIISSVALNHATPASFYAHVDNRSQYDIIASQLLKSNFDFFAGGSIILKSISFQQYIDSLKKAGYAVALTKEEFYQTINNNQKVFLTDTSSLDKTALYYTIDSINRVSLADFLMAAIKHLDNKNGFFIMLEGGKIDWASHQNDVATMIYELLDFNKAISVAYQFYKKHPKQTLIIVTADHETGGLSLGYRTKGYQYDLSQLAKQLRSKDYITRTLKQVKHQNLQIALYQFVKLKLPLTEQLSTNQYINLVIDSLQHSAGIGWNSNVHTANFIVTYAIGVGAEKLNGLIDNTHIFFLIKNAMGL